MKEFEHSPDKLTPEEIEAIKEQIELDKIAVKMGLEPFETWSTGTGEPKT